MYMVGRCGYIYMQIDVGGHGYTVCMQSRDRRIIVQLTTYYTRYSGLLTIPIRTTLGIIYSANFILFSYTYIPDK